MAEARFETRDANAKWIAIIALGVILGSVVMHGALVIYQTGLKKEFGTPKAPPLLAPKPPTYKLEALREAEDATLRSTGWVDEKAGIARIPIEDAMERIAHGE